MLELNSFCGRRDLSPKTEEKGLFVSVLELIDVTAGTKFKRSLKRSTIKRENNEKKSRIY
ncbi:hypothetical protein HN789_01710 [archaeon]|jgi:hypothetical protein|nr:hypothetical protein [archaeon]MBT3721052.1 hypothetical protein [archaeon]MBT4022531.1 hypothetical protein [archaeon]MBT4272857.1 hypothetical protein [archaeon]MBT4461657.1 hypothetical protein [archaeon]